jgi:hypothetical protein
MSAENDSHQESSESKRRGADLWPALKNIIIRLPTAFKNFAIIFSFIVNFVLVIVLLIVAGWILFPAKTDLVEPLLDDLQGAIDALGEATIVTTIPIDRRVPVSFTLPLNQATVVVLSQNVALERPATFYLPGGGGSIRGTVVLNLPQGLELPVLLNLDVPVDNTIPVQFDVEVSIPLKETELEQVVVKLNKVLGPIRDYLDKLPDGYDF